MKLHTLILALATAAAPACSIEGETSELTDEEIFGGKSEPDYTQAGWIAQKKSDGTWDFVCGGVFLGSRMVATAAHCVEKYFVNGNTRGDVILTNDNNQWEKRIKFGFGSFDKGKGGTVIRRITMHPHWNRGRWNGSEYRRGEFDARTDCSNHDLAVLELASTPNISVKGATIASPFRPATSKTNWFHKVVGYGSTNISVLNEGKRRSVEQRVFTRTGTSDCPNDSDECATYVKGPASGVFWAASHDQDTPCVGDSGSPLFIKNGTKYKDGKGVTRTPIDKSPHVAGLLIGSLTREGRDRCRPGEYIAYVSLKAHEGFLKYAIKPDDHERQVLLDDLKARTSPGECFSDNFEENIDPYSEADPLGGECLDECSAAGAKECAGDIDNLDYLECGQFDDDACLDWGAFSCETWPGTTCSDGWCVGN